MSDDRNRRFGHTVLNPSTDREPKNPAVFGDEELYMAMVENIADGIAITVKTERVFVNRAFLEEFVFREDREVVRERTLARQRGEHPDDVVEYRIQRPDGEIRTVQVSVVTTTYKGQPATLAVLRDVTDKKRAEAEIMRLNQELEQKILDLRNANDELEAFNSTVSHDLQTPLMVIKAFCRRISEKYASSLDRKFIEQMGTIQASAQRMEQLINDLLAYAKLGKQALQRKRIPMNELIESVIADLRALYPDGEVIVPPLADCIGDERMLRQMFVNLISNAFKFTSRQAKRVIEIGRIQGTTENVFFIKDNGAGFDMEHKDKLFTVFQRLHSQEEFSGTGMGLAIVKRIAGLHGGTVWAEGNPGSGATFYVALPR
jgi:PAS domain S-box-containing protein